MTVENSAAVDLTTLFKSCVKTIRTRNKAMGVTLPQTKIFPSAPSPSSQFYSTARDIISNIASHRNLLRDHRKKYLQDQEQGMSDYERSYMEKVVTTNLRIIDVNIRTLVIDFKNDEQGSKDACDCQQSIISILKVTFEEINSSFTQMKEMRKKRQKEKDTLFRLQRSAGSKKRSTNSSEDLSRAPQPSQLGRRGSSHENCDDSHTESADSQSTEQASHESPHHRDRKEGQAGESMEEGTGVTNSEKSRTSSSFLEEEMERVLGELSAEEKQMLEEENAHLYKEMSNHEEVHQITRQVVELGQMQDILLENVDLQAHQIEEIQDTIMAASENVREGNEQVRKAMRKDAGFRVWIMFFLIVMSCTILFIDWYNG